MTTTPAGKKGHPILGLLVIAAVIAVIASACHGSGDTTSAPTTSSSAGDTAPAVDPAPSAAPAPAAPPTPDTTPSQQQALAKARDYLDTSAFSQSGLSGQLQYEGFTAADADWAAANCGADWNAQAATKAQDYLGTSHFSHSGLVGQLEYDGFTPGQAESGVQAAGL